MPGPELRIAGRVAQLFERPMVVADHIECVAGLGIRGEKHASRISPRQILVTLAAELASLSIAPGALFENMVVSLNAGQYFRPGAALVFDGGAEIRLTMFCEPCKVIQPLTGDLKKMMHRRGILGVVVDGGEVRRGERFSLIPDRYEALPDSLQQRFADFLATVPSGRVVRYLDVTTAMGVDKSFIRALPGYIRRSGSLGLPLHRIVNARGALPGFIRDQGELLTGEGVQVNGGHVDLLRYRWEG